jgi:uncharacterized membrane protein HdeD (DUF308 family)
MALNTQDQSPDSPSAETTCFRKNWRWLLTLGVAQILAGAFAMGSCFGTAFAPTVTIAVALLAAAATQLAVAVLARKWDGFYLFLLLAFIYLVAGLLTFQRPDVAAEGLFLMLAALFLLIGLFRITVALVENLPGWRWVCFNGIVALLLGVAIWRRWPERALWVVGVAIGIELVLNGMTWSALALGAREPKSHGT